MHYEFLSSDRLRTVGAQREEESFIKIRSPVLRRCNRLLTSSKSDGGLSETRIAFFERGVHQMDRTDIHEDRAT